MIPLIPHSLIASATGEASHVADTLVQHADTLAHAAGQAAEHGDHGEHALHELPNFVQMIYKSVGEKAHLLSYWEPIIFAFIAAVVLSILAMVVYRNRQLLPGKLQNVVELVVEGLYNFLYLMLGKHTATYLPLLGTLFVYILLMNWMGLIPFFKASTSSANVTVSLAIFVFFFSHSVGFKHLGFKGWFLHLLGSPNSTIEWILSPLQFAIHLIGELAKPVSLALRLFGNITGEDILIFAITAIGVLILSFLNLPIGLPLQVPFYLLGLLLSTIQALVFMSLSAIYILMMLPHEHDDEKHSH